MKIHLESMGGGYECSQSFYQMPISKKLAPYEFEIELHNNPDGICQRCAAIYFRKAPNLKNLKKHYSATLSCGGRE